MLIKVYLYISECVLMNRPFGYFSSNQCIQTHFSYLSVVLLMYVFLCSNSFKLVEMGGPYTTHIMIQ